LIESVPPRLYGGTERIVSYLTKALVAQGHASQFPVRAFRNGSVPEVIDKGVTGEVVDNVNEAICKIRSVLALDRGRYADASSSGSRLPAWPSTTLKSIGS
jgi:hypothetical protein